MTNLNTTAETWARKINEVRRHPQVLGEGLDEVEPGAALTRAPEHVHHLHRYLVRDGLGEELAELAKIESSVLVYLGA